MEIPKIHEGEYRFCLIMWEHEPISAAQLVKLCQEQLGWKRTTTYTVIKRLGERGILKNEDGIVTALVSKDEAQACEIDELVEKKFEGSLPAFIAAFTKRQDLSNDELDEVQQMIDRIRKGGSNMSELFLKIVNMSISASWVVIAVLTLRFCLKKAPKWVNVLLWGIVAARMVFPFSIESVLSLIPSAETISPTVMMEQTPSVQTGVPALNHVINPVISSSFTPAPGASANPLQIWIPVLTGIWLFGIAALFLYSAVSYWRLHRKVCEAVILRGNIYQSEKVCSPIVLGIIKPKIYLPYHMDSREMDHVIAHEQTHIRRKDHWWKPLGFLLLTIHWFNPLMWLSYILLCRDIELACDEKVIREMGNEQRADYTQALVACSVNRRVIAACPLAFGEVGVKERVKSVMNYKKPAFWIVLASVIVCAAAAVCFLTNPKSEGSNDITELLAPGSAWSYQLGYDADFPVDASFTV